MLGDRYMLLIKRASLLVLALLLLLATPVSATNVKKGYCGTDSKVKRNKDCDNVSVGKDYTQDSGCGGSWLLFNTGEGSEAAAELDRCANGGVDSMTHNGTFAEGASVPAGTPAGRASVVFDGADEYFSLASQAEFQGNEFTAYCWIYPTAASLDIFFGKNDVTAWEMLRVNTGVFQFEVNDARENGVTITPENAWVFTVLRYSSSGAGTTEMFTDALDDCNSGCQNASDPTGNSNPLVIGASHSFGNKWVGEIMECNYLVRALTNQEILEVMLCGTDGLADGEARDMEYGAMGSHCSDLPDGSCCS